MISNYLLKSPFSAFPKPKVHHGCINKKLNLFCTCIFDFCLILNKITSNLHVLRFYVFRSWGERHTPFKKKKTKFQVLNRIKIESTRKKNYFSLESDSSNFIQFKESKNNDLHLLKK